MGRDDDDFDEQEPLPDPTMRTWRHPSEIAAVAAMAAREEQPPRPRRPVAVGSLLLGGALGALVVLGAIGSVRLLDDGRGEDRFELRDAGAVLDDEAPAVAAAPHSGTGGGGGTAGGRSGGAPEEGAGTTTIAAEPDRPDRDASTTTTTEPNGTGGGPPASIEPLVGELSVAAVAVPSEAIVGVALDHRASRLRCTGLAVDGLVVTSSSAIGDADEVTLVVAGTTYRAPVVGRDAFTDIAVIAPPADAPLHELPAAGPMAADAPVALVATDGRPEPITVAGRITGWDHTVAASDGHDVLGLVSTSARLPRSGAGSLLVDPHGGLVGMVVDTPGHLAMAVPEPTLRQIARYLRDTGHPVPVWVGVSVSERAEGVAVEDVAPGGPADTAGLRSGDVITDLDGHATADLPTFFTRVRSLQVGDRPEVRFQRHGERHTANIELADPPGKPPSSDEQAAD